MIPSPRRAGDDEPDTAITRALATRAVAGDREAFGELYRLHAGTVYTFARSRTRNDTLAHDIVADTFVRALHKIHTFTGWNGGGFPAWLITIARNLLADHYKASRTRCEIPVAEWFEGDAVTPPVDDQVLTDATAAAVRAAIARLSPDQRACIEARFLQQLDVAETADRLGKNDGAIRTLQFRAVRALGRDHALIGALAT